MKIINIHQRDYELSVSVLSDVLNSLSTENDLLWPKEEWMPMVLDNGLNPNSKGGHGPIEYYVEEYEFGKMINFCFTKPREFIGNHRFEILKLNAEKTRLKHTIDMKVNFKGLVSWYVAIKWLHDALLEDCLDKVYNLHNESKMNSPHSLWVRTLRKILKGK